MRVLFINPPYPERSFGFKDIIIVEPLILEYLAGAIPEEESYILDMVIEPEGLEDFIKKTQPDLIVISCYTIHVDKVKEISRTIKSMEQDTKIVVGGLHSRYRPGDFQIDTIDIVTITASISNFSDLIRGIKGNSLNTVEGISYQENHHWYQTAPYQEQVDIDNYPNPRRDLTKHYRKNYKWFYQKEVAMVLGSMGCPNRCEFCTQWVKTNGKFFARSADSLVKEIASIDEEIVFIADDNTFLDRKRAWEICRLLKERDIQKKLIGYCSPDIAVNCPELIKSWAEAGLVQVVVGFESVRDKDLIDIKHKVDVEKSIKAIKVFKENNIDVMASFILYPDMSKSDFKRLRKFISRNGIFYSEFTPLTPLIGTKLFDRTEEQILYYDYQLFDMQHMVYETALPLKEFYKEMVLCYVQSHNFFVRAPKSLKVKLNPLYKTNISFLKLLKRIRSAHKEHLDKYKIEIV